MTLPKAAIGISVLFIDSTVRRNRAGLADKIARSLERAGMGRFLRV